MQADTGELTAAEAAEADLVWKALETIRDPCHALCDHDLNIVDLGIINWVSRDDDRLAVGITFTEPACTFAHRIIEAVEDLAPAIPGIREIRVSVEAWPAWDPSRLSARARDLYEERRLRYGPSARTPEGLRRSLLPVFVEPGPSEVEP